MKNVRPSSFTEIEPLHVQRFSLIFHLKLCVWYFSFVVIIQFILFLLGCIPFSVSLPLSRRNCQCCWWHSFSIRTIMPHQLHVSFSSLSRSYFVCICDDTAELLLLKEHFICDAHCFITFLRFSLNKTKAIYSAMAQCKKKQVAAAEQFPFPMTKKRKKTIQYRHTHTIQTL